MIVIRVRVSNGDIPNTSSRKLINRRRIIDLSTNCNNDDLPVAIKADSVGGEDTQRKSGRPRAMHAYVRSLHHIIPSTFFHLALR